MALNCEIQLLHCVNGCVSYSRGIVTVRERSIVISLFSLCLCVHVCLSTSISLESLDRSSYNFLCRFPVAIARSSCGSIAICYMYVLSVLWMISRLAVVGHMAMRGRLNL